MSEARGKMELAALGALFAGALCTGSAGVLVRLSETGPVATAFWRGCLGLPALAIWALLESRATERSARESPVGRESPTGAKPRRIRTGDAALSDAGLPEGGRWLETGSAHRARGAVMLASFRDTGFLWAGVFFAGDLALWNWALVLTSVAAATLEASLAPLIVTFVAWVYWRERPTTGFLVATVFALAGMALIVSPKLSHGGSAILGDALGLGTAFFFAGYLLCVARLRAVYGTGTVMFNSTLVFTLLLLPLALSQKFFPDTAKGWAILAGCAVGAHVLGQGLIAYALAHLRPTFSSLGLLIQALGAAVSAWLVLGERLATLQIIGALAIVGAIAMARATRSQMGATPSPGTGASLGVIRD
jgi:drug/metabolite transporter (DMT)-like permease